MAGIDIRKFLNNFAQNYNRQPYSAQNAALSTSQKAVEPTPPMIKTPASANLAQNIVQDKPGIILAQNLQMNTLQSIDRSSYAKEVMQLPKNLNEFVYMVQRGMSQAQLNQSLTVPLSAQQKVSVTQIQAQILAQLQGTQAVQQNIVKDAVSHQLTNQLQNSLKNLEILPGAMIKLDDMSFLFQKNGKEAITKLIMSMTEASKSGITDLTQMKDMAKLINASVAIASENNPPKTLKLLLMLYLPWLPLEDGVGFDLEIQPKSESKDDSDSILVITVTTINYGIVKATLVLETSNSVQVSIESSEKFPRKELKLRVEGEQKFYAMDSVLTFTTNESIKPLGDAKQSASVNMSQTTQINPYMLLMAHTLIKNIIEIDNNTTMGLISHTDD